MNTVSNLTIFKRLGLGYLLIVLFVIALGMYSALKLGQLNQITLDINSINNEIIRIANSLRSSIISQREFEKKYVILRDNDFYQRFQDTEKYFERDLGQIGIIINTDEEKGFIGDIKEGYAQYHATVQEEVLLITDNKGYAQETYEKRKEALVDQIIRDLEGVTEAARTDMNNKIETSGKIGLQASKVAVMITIVSVVMAVLIAFFTARTINRPIIDLIKGTREIAGGRFEKHLTILSPPEINELANAYNHMCDQLKELDDIKADLISNISHELRTPLAIIREAVSLNLDSISSGSIEKQRQLSGIIGEECERLINSVNKILNLSRMEAGMMDYHFGKCNLANLLEIGVSKIGPILERKGIALKLNIDCNLPPARIDAEKIGQVIDILLDNALKFTPEKGRLAIVASIKDGKTSKGSPSDIEKGLIEVYVLDSGCGISKENIRNIFLKFKKLHGKGTGLGLYIAKQIISAHGGEIWVKSVEKKGSAFFFTVPVF